MPQKLSVSTCYHRNWNQLSSCYLSQRVDDFVIGHVSTDVQAFHNFVIIKLYARNDIFKRIKKKHGQVAITVILQERTSNTNVCESKYFNKKCNSQI